MARGYETRLQDREKVYALHTRAPVWLGVPPPSPALFFPLSVPLPFPFLIASSLYSPPLPLFLSLPIPLSPPFPSPTFILYFFSFLPPYFYFSSSPLYASSPFLIPFLPPPTSFYFSPFPLLLPSPSPFFSLFLPFLYALPPSPLPSHSQRGP